MIVRAGGAQRALVLGATLFIFTFALAFGAGTAAAGVWVKEGAARAVGSFWTPARMRAAEPLELQGRHGGRGSGRAVASDRESRGGSRR